MPADPPALVGCLLRGVMICGCVDRRGLRTETLADIVAIMHDNWANAQVRPSSSMPICFA
jgi:hypothetical protein